MSSVFVIDGPDGTGKSTLASKISKMYKIPSYHLTWYDDKEKFQEQFANIAEKLDSFIKGSGGGFIVDRYILSEIVYNKIYRPDTKIIDNAAEMLETLLTYTNTDSKVMLIFALPHDKEKWLSNFEKLCKEREEMYGPEKMGKIYDEFENHWNEIKSGRNVYRYDFTDTETDDNTFYFSKN